MVIGKHINRYYLRYAPALLLGLLTLVAVDVLQLRIPNLYQMVINGINDGYVLQGGEQIPFDLAFLLDRICMPLLTVIVCMVLDGFCGECASSAQPSASREISGTECSIISRTCPKAITSKIRSAT